MYCKKCGTYNSNNNLRCSKCGDNLVNQILENESTNNDDLKLDIDNDLDNNYNKKDKRKDDINNKSRNKVKKKIVTKNKTKTKKIKEKNKDRNNSKDNNYKKDKEVIVKTPLSSKITILLLSFLVIILILISGYLGFYILDDKLTVMPNVVNMSLDDGIKVLEDKDIKYKVIYPDNYTDNNSLVITNQSSNSGSFIKKSSIVNITTSSISTNNSNSNNKDNNKTENKFKVDNYVGMNIEDVIKILKKNNISYSIENKESDKEDGIILNQDVNPDTYIDSDTTINLVISVKNNDSINNDVE